MTEGFSLIFSVHNREVMLFLEDEEGVYIFCCLRAKGGGVNLSVTIHTCH